MGGIVTSCDLVSMDISDTVPVSCHDEVRGTLPSVSYLREVHFACLGAGRRCIVVDKGKCGTKEVNLEGYPAPCCLVEG